MTILEFLNQIGNLKDFSRKSLILLITYYLRKYKGTLEFSVSDIRGSFQDISLKVPSDLARLTRGLTKGKNSPLLRTKKKYFSLSLDGVREVESYLTSDKQNPAAIESFIHNAITYLEKIISKVEEDNKRRFLAEAIACIKVRAKRATIIMTWLMALQHLYDYVLSKKLKDFNLTLSQRRDRYNKIQVTTRDDFSDVKESVFIEICRSSGIISNDVRKILDEKLGIRNTCAHPSNVEIHDSKVVNFIEEIVDNVIDKYKI
ncbi:MAG: hypothetical protein Q6354_03970 [Candidatus Brocadiales bacterium]|nr:hypothetical protein [Candidatus Brocadiales bacterium]